MKKIVLAIMCITTVFLLPLSNAAAFPNKKADGPATLNVLIPPSLAGHLQDLGFAAAELKPVQAQHDSRGIFMFQSDSGDKLAAVMHNPGARGMLVLADGVSAEDNTWQIITFDAASNTYSAVDPQEMTPECLMQIARAVKSFLFIAYDCVAVGDPRTCLSSIVDFFIDLYFITIYCEQEPVPDNSTSTQY